MELICDVNSTYEHPSTGGTLCFEHGISPVWISNDTVLLFNGEDYDESVFRIIHFGKPIICHSNDQLAYYVHLNMSLNSKQVFGFCLRSAMNFASLKLCLWLWVWGPRDLCLRCSTGCSI